MGSHRHSRKSENVRTVIICVLFVAGLMVAIGSLFWYWNQNEFVPDAGPGNPVDTKMIGR